MVQEVVFFGKLSCQKEMEFKLSKFFQPRVCEGWTGATIRDHTSGQKLEQEQPPTMTAPTKTEVAMQNLMDVFYQYVEGDKCTLTRAQMKSLVDTELNQLIK
ncbi:hypothetical protein scyTo_0025033, partial [Scyliorhinus torazame]|nr:hypothetical protein [Scyliorhinus torazame]